MDDSVKTVEPCVETGEPPPLVWNIPSTRKKNCNIAIASQSHTICKSAKMDCSKALNKGILLFIQRSFDSQRKIYAFCVQSFKFD